MMSVIQSIPIDNTGSLLTNGLKNVTCKQDLRYDASVDADAPTVYAQCQRALMRHLPGNRKRRPAGPSTSENMKETCDYENCFGTLNVNCVIIHWTPLTTNQKVQKNCTL